jgi:hypothetical protein
MVAPSVAASLGEVRKDDSPSMTGYGSSKTKERGHSVASRLLWMEHSFLYLMACVFVILTRAPCWLSPLNSKTLPTRGAEVKEGCRHKNRPTDLATALPELLHRLAKSVGDTFQPNVGCLILKFRVREVPSSVLDSESYGSGWGYSPFSLVTPRKCSDKFNRNHDHFLQHPSELIISRLSSHTTSCGRSMSDSRPADRMRPPLMFYAARLSSRIMHDMRPQTSQFWCIKSFKCISNSYLCIAVLYFNWPSTFKAHLF